MCSCRPPTCREVLCALRNADIPAALGLLVSVAPMLAIQDQTRGVRGQAVV